MSKTTKKQRKKTKTCNYDKPYFKQKTCRLCWSSEIYIDITEEPIYGGFKTYSELFFYCLNLETNEDRSNYPKHLCQQCYQRLESIYLFRKSCIRKNNKLIKLFEERTPSPIPNKIDYDEQLKVSDTESLKNDADQDEYYGDKPDYFEVEVDVILEKSKDYSAHNDYYCYLCYEEFADESTYLEHRKLHSDNDADFSYKCYGCNKEFGQLSTRLRHEIYHCKILKAGYKCKLCELVLPTRNKLKSHVKNHRSGKSDTFKTEYHNCNICNEQFRVKSQLWLHIRKVHDHTDVVCEICGKHFKSKTSLYYHQGRHTGIKNYSCNLCDFKTIQKGTLNIHMRRHSGEKPYACDRCPYRCTSSANLTKHKRTHDGIKRFQCDRCEKKYGYKDSLLEHMSSAHDAIKHSCPQCGSTFIQIRNLRKHLKSVHNIVMSADKVKNALTMA